MGLRESGVTMWVFSTESFHSTDRKDSDRNSVPCDSGVELFLSSLSGHYSVSVVSLRPELGQEGADQKHQKGSQTGP